MVYHYVYNLVVLNYVGYFVSFYSDGSFSKKRLIRNSSFSRKLPSRTWMAPSNNETLMKDTGNKETSPGKCE